MSGINSMTLDGQRGPSHSCVKEDIFGRCRPPLPCVRPAAISDDAPIAGVADPRVTHPKPKPESRPPTDLYRGRPLDDSADLFRVWLIFFG
jgi:hypothetical protein